MAVRQIEPIDRAELRATIQKWIDAHTDVDDTDGVGLLEDVLWEINAQPTLTPPNEWAQVLEAINNEAVAYIEGGPYKNDLPGMELALKVDRLSRDFVRPPEGVK